MKQFSDASIASALACIAATALAAAHLLFFSSPLPVSQPLSAPALTQGESPPSAEASMKADPQLPAILSLTDRKYYTQLFLLQERGDWNRADRIMQKIKDPVLLGYVQAQRYLHKKYTSSPGELARWLKRNAALPQAQHIYSLARRKGAQQVATPQYSALKTPIGNTQPIERFGSSLLNRYLKNHPLRSQIRALLVAESRQKALTLLSHSRHLSQRDYDLLRWYIAGSFFNHGEYRQAALLAQASANRSGTEIPALHWLAGISYWHRGNISKASAHFSAMAHSASQLTNADAATSAFWAYRTAKKLGKTQLAISYLNQSAEFPNSFYGVQANKLLQRKLDLNLVPEPVSEEELQAFSRQPILRRSMALAEIGHMEEAEKELRNYYLAADKTKRPSLLSLAVMMDLPAIQIRMAMDLAKQGIPQPDYALYPTPDWQPYNGYAIDPSLIFAIARQESGFNAAARSHAGAAGIMQIMPQTARYLLNRTNANPTLPIKNASIQDPITNITLGQQYIHHLQQQPAIRNNLIYLIAAYNAGPAAVINWQKQLAYQNDPLLFIESIPFTETRSYVLNVLTNYWMYNEIRGVPSPAIHALLAGNWPLYQHAAQEVATIAPPTLRASQLPASANAL